MGTRDWLFAVLLLVPPGLRAEIRTGAAFLKIGTGARPSAMGGAYTALADDVNALFYNPAGLAAIRSRELGLTHAEWLLGSKFDFIGYTHPSKWGGMGLGVTRLATGGLQGRDASRNRTGDFEASDTAFTLSFSRNILGAPNGPRRPMTEPWRTMRFVGMDEESSKETGRRMGLADDAQPKPSRRGKGGRANGPPPRSLTSLGGSVKFVQSRVGNYSAGAFALDLGVIHGFAAAPVTVGASVLNLGRGLRFFDQADPLPLTVALGAAYRLAGALQLAVDVRHEPHDRATSAGFGTEYSILSSFALRAGYTSAAGGAAASGGGLSSLRGLGAGFGLRIRGWRADYTFTPFGELGNVQRVSLGARW